MDSLISRRKTIEYLMTNMGWTDEDGYAVDDADEKRAHIEDLINGVPSVPAVPLDKLCEWLAGYVEPPLDALTICDNLFEAWKMTLTGLMEEQDVDRQ